MASYSIINGVATDRAVQIGHCIYCGQDAHGDEHIVPHGAGGTLVLADASCRACAKKINRFEANVLNTILQVPRVSQRVRRKRRKRPTVDKIHVMATVQGREVKITLPVSEYPPLFFLPQLVPPGILVNRAPTEGFLGGAWVKLLRPVGYRMKGAESYTSPVLNSQNFCRFLAKIGHGFAVHTLGLDGFKPMLTNFILNGSDDGWCHLVGGTVTFPAAADDHLHELSLSNYVVGSATFAVVQIRLFANLGSPSYLAVASSNIGESCLA